MYYLGSCCCCYCCRLSCVRSRLTPHVPPPIQGLLAAALAAPLPQTSVGGGESSVTDVGVRAVAAGCEEERGAIPIDGVHSTSGANRTIHSTSGANRTIHSTSRSSTMPTKLDVELTTTKWLRDYIVRQASDAGIYYTNITTTSSRCSMEIIIR